MRRAGQPDPATVALLAALDAYVDQRVDARLRERGVTGDEYSSDNRPGSTSLRTFNETCRSGAVAGATKEGRLWRCGRLSWHAARGRRPTPAAPDSGVRVGFTREQLVDLAIERARGGRR